MLTPNSLCACRMAFGSTPGVASRMTSKVLRWSSRGNSLRPLHAKDPAGNMCNPAACVVIAIAWPWLQDGSCDDPCHWRKADDCGDGIQPPATDCLEGKFCFGARAARGSTFVSEPNFASRVLASTQFYCIQESCASLESVFPTCNSLSPGLSRKEDEVRRGGRVKKTSRLFSVRA